MSQICLIVILIWVCMHGMNQSHDCFWQGRFIIMSGHLLFQLQLKLLVQLFRRPFLCLIIDIGVALISSLTASCFCQLKNRKIVLNQCTVHYVFQNWDHRCIVMFQQGRYKEPTTSRPILIPWSCYSMEDGAEFQMKVHFRSCGILLQH
jgi:hypothetical protein